MPTYYACGCEYDTEPYDDTESLDYRCDSCDEDDYDEDDTNIDSGAARAAANHVNSLAEWEIPVMKSSSVTRQVSCEWEADTGVHTARHALGLLDRGAYFQFEDDSTCGGELQFGRLRLNDSDKARDYGRSLATIQHLHRAGAVRVSYNAGHHIHVSARNADGRGFTPNNLVSLYQVYSHMEDLLYRLAAAGWNQHRGERAGEDWSKPIPKLGREAKTPKNVGNAIAGDKYQGLNVGPYIRNIRQCRCGAFQFADWAECTCPDDYATIEWRLWNACVSPRKVRAYIVISNNITEYASVTDSGECAHLLENPFIGTGNVNEDSLSRQLDYLLSRPGFTSNDRDDILWLVQRSPGMGRLARDYAASEYDDSPREA